jgi:hypothetical protein
MAFPDDPCEWCPRVPLGLGGVCVCQARLLSALCGQQRDGDARYTAMILGEVVPAPTPTPPAPPRAPFEPFTRETLERIRACPSRVAPACGCALPECAQGKGNAWHLVTLEDCRACLAAVPPGDG